VAAPDRTAKAREFIDSDLHDAIEMIDDVVKLPPNAGLPASPKLDDELSRARAALTSVRRIARALARDAEEATTDG
jgi:hypothetical protein